MSRKGAEKPTPLSACNWVLVTAGAIALCAVRAAAAVGRAGSAAAARTADALSAFLLGLVNIACGETDDHGYDRDNDQICHKNSF